MSQQGFQHTVERTGIPEGSPTIATLKVNALT